MQLYIIYRYAIVCNLLVCNCMQFTGMQLYAIDWWFVLKMSWCKKVERNFLATKTDQTSSKKVVPPGAGFYLLFCKYFNAPLPPFVLRRKLLKTTRNHCLMAIETVDQFKYQLSRKKNTFSKEILFF